MLGRTGSRGGVIQAIVFLSFIFFVCKCCPIYLRDAGFPSLYLILFYVSFCLSEVFFALFRPSEQATILQAANFRCRSASVGWPSSPASSNQILIIDNVRLMTNPKSHHWQLHSVCRSLPGVPELRATRSFSSHERCTFFVLNKSRNVVGRTPNCTNTEAVDFCFSNSHYQNVERKSIEEAGNCEHRFPVQRSASSSCTRPRLSSLAAASCATSSRAEKPHQSSLAAATSSRQFGDVGKGRRRKSRITVSQAAKMIVTQEKQKEKW